MIGFGEAIGLYYRRYFDFVGRSSRAEYWWFQLYIWVVILLVFIALGMTVEDIESEELESSSVIIVIGLGLFILAHIIGSITLAVRRFHDLDQTGWLVLVFFILGLIPLLGLFVTLGQIIWFIFPGTKGPNRYGPDPNGYDETGPF